MKYQQLVVNGCSYAETYAEGGGHEHLAQLLGIPSATSLAIGGSANSRIMRTVLKHSYETSVPTLYVMGMTFLSRNEIPILNNAPCWEGNWTNPQNQAFSKQWIPTWKQSDTELYVTLKLKSEMYSTIDRLEDLQYRILSVIGDLKNRGHGVVVFQQADDIHLEHMDNPRVKLFSESINIVGGYRWRAIPWQHEQGVPMAYHNPDVDPDITHRVPGQHEAVNQYLADYIIQNQLI